MKHRVRIVVIAASLCLTSAPMFATAPGGTNPHPQTATAPGGTNPHPQSLIDLFMSLFGL